MSEFLRGSLGGSSPPDVRLILLGNIGCGKTSTGDTVLGELSATSLSAFRSCQLRQGLSDNRNVTLVEAPRWFWIGGEMEDSIKKETQHAMTLVAPGPHAVLLLVPVNQFTEMEGRIPAALKEMFGEEVLDHTLVLLTCGDYLMRMSVQEYLQKEDPGLRQIIEDCGGRYHVINNRQRQDREQVQQLLEKVDDMVKQNGVFHMKTAQEREMERRVKEKKKELMELHKTQQRDIFSTTPATNAITQTSVDGGEQYITSLNRREERDVMETLADVSHVSNRLYSTPAAEKHSYSEQHYDKNVLSVASNRQNEGGAMLSQVSKVKSPERQITASHHRINSPEVTSPKTSPASAPQVPVFSSSSPSSPSFDSSSSTYLSSTSSSPELRLVLLGRSGAGKSAAGNVILGQEEFESYPESLTAITRECVKQKALVGGRRVAVVDTPDWFNSEKTPEEVRAQISSCVTLSSPGPHAFLMCVPLDQPAKTELQALRALEAVFGPDAVQKHTLVLFTYADRLRESGKTGKDSIEAYIASQRGDLLKIVEKCDDRFHIMNMEGGPRQRSNVEELLDKVEHTVEEAGGQCYSCPAFQEAEKRLRERQLEIARKKKENKVEEETSEDVRQLSSQRRVLYPYMQPLAEADEEEVREDEIEKTRDEAEKSVRTMNIESLPPITLSTISPSLLQSIMEKMGSNAETLKQLVSDSSVWVSDGAKKVKSSPMWGTLGSGAQNIQKRVADSSVWGKVGASAGHVSKMVGDRVPKVVVDSSAWVGSGAKAAAASPVWGKVGSGAKMVADNSMRVGASMGASVGAGAKNLAQSPMWGKVGSGAKMVADNSMRVGASVGAGAKNLAQSPVWGKVGSGAKSGAKMVAQNSVRLGAGIGSGAKKVAQSPVWGKVGSGAKAGAKMVAESSVWEKIGATAKKVPKVVIAGALLGLVLGVVLWGVIGGVVGAAAGSAVSEVGRRKLSKQSTLEKTKEAAQNVAGRENYSADALLKQKEKMLKTE